MIFNFYKLLDNPVTQNITLIGMAKISYAYKIEGAPWLLAL